jgi:hypothetical protein
MTLEARHAILDALQAVFVRPLWVACGKLFQPVDSGYSCRFLTSSGARVLANAIGCGNVISRCQEGC